MLNILIRMIVIGFFGLLGFTNLVVLRDVVHDLIQRHEFGEFTGWTQRLLEEYFREYQGKHRSIFQDLMPTILSLILILIFYLSGDLLMTDVLAAILIFDDGQTVRNHLLKRPPFPVRAAIRAKEVPQTKALYSRLFLMEVTVQTLASLFFVILPYVYVMITK